MLLTRGSLAEKCTFGTQKEKKMKFDATSVLGNLKKGFLGTKEGKFKFGGMTTSKLKRK